MTSATLRFIRFWLNLFDGVSFNRNESIELPINRQKAENKVTKYIFYDMNRFSFGPTRYTAGNHVTASVSIYTKM